MASGPAQAARVPTKAERVAIRDHMVASDPQIRLQRLVISTVNPHFAMLVSEDKFFGGYFILQRKNGLWREVAVGKALGFLDSQGRAAEGQIDLGRRRPHA